MSKKKKKNVTTFTSLRKHRSRSLFRDQLIFEGSSWARRFYYMPKLQLNCSIFFVLGYVTTQISLRAVQKCGFHPGVYYSLYGGSAQVCQRFDLPACKNELLRRPNLRLRLRYVYATITLLFDFIFL